MGKQKSHLEAEGYVNARANYEEAMRSTADEERRIELHEAYHRTYLVPVYADRPIQRDPSGELFVKARLLRKEERWLEAAEIYMQLANSTLPAEDTVYSLYWAGRCYHEATSIIASLFGKSVDAFDKLIAEYEDSSYTIAVYYHLSLAYTDWAKISGDESKWQLVINTVEEANTKYADSDDTTVQGWLSRMQKLREEALKKLPPQPDLLKEEAEVAIKTAETEITRAKQENREPLLIHEANEHLKHAKHHMRQNDYTDALSSAEKALEVINKIRPKPSPIENYVEQGYIYLKQNELEAATQKARQALNLNPTYAPAHKLNSKIKHRYYGLGWMFFDEGQYNKAITEFKNAINIDSNFKEAHCHLGVIYIEQQKYAEAIQTLEKAISIDEAFKEAHFNLALAHLELGEFAEATNAANAALNIDPYYEPADILIKLIAD